MAFLGVEAVVSSHFKIQAAVIGFGSFRAPVDTRPIHYMLGLKMSPLQNENILKGPGHHARL